MLSRLMSLLVHNLQVVERLAESRPVRRAAQITAYALTKARIAGRDALGSRVPGDLGRVGGRLRRLRDSFVDEVKDGWKDGSRQIKK